MHYTVFYQRVKNDGTFSPSQSTYTSLKSAYKQYYTVLGNYIGDSQYSKIEVALMDSNGVVMESKAWDNTTEE